MMSPGGQSEEHPWLAEFYGRTGQAEPDRGEVAAHGRRTGRHAGRRPMALPYFAAVRARKDHFPIMESGL